MRTMLSVDVPLSASGISIVKAIATVTPDKAVPPLVFVNVMLSERPAAILLNVLERLANALGVACVKAVEAFVRAVAIPVLDAELKS